MKLISSARGKINYLISWLALIYFSSTSLAFQTAPLSREATLSNQLEESNRELIRLRAQSQANEIASRQALRDATQKVTEKAQLLNEQEAINAKLTQQANADAQLRAELLKATLEISKEENKYSFYKVLTGQLISAVITVSGFVFTFRKLKLQHSWALKENEERKTEANEFKVETEAKLNEISAILNNEQAPSKRWLDAS